MDHGTDHPRRHKKKRLRRGRSSIWGKEWLNAQLARAAEREPRIDVSRIAQVQCALRDQRQEALIARQRTRSFFVYYAEPDQRRRRTWQAGECECVAADVGQRNDRRSNV